MNLVLLLCLTTLLGAVCGHAAHAGNFMASSPCFSFQGQNILWPSGPQGLSGMSSSSPWSWFNHPFFGGGNKPGVRGAPVESALPSEPEEPATPPTSAPAPLPAPVPAPPTQPAPTPVLVNVVPANNHPSVTELAHDDEVVHKDEPAHDDEVVHEDEPHHNVIDTKATISSHSDETEIKGADDITPSETVSSNTVVDDTLSVSDKHDDVDEIVPATTSSKTVTDIDDEHLIPESSDHHVDKDSHDIDTAPSNVEPITSTLIHHADHSRKPSACLEKSDCSVSSSESIETPASTSEIKEEEALLPSMPGDSITPCSSASHIIPPLIDACNISSHIPPVIDTHPCNTSCPIHPIDIIDHLHPLPHPCIPHPCDHIPIFDIANITLPPIVDVCNISSLNASDLTPISCHDAWNYCDYPGLHPVPYHPCSHHSYEPYYDGHHEIYSHPVSDYPCVLDDHHIHHHTLHNHCFDYPGYETNVLPPISYFNISNPNELNLTDIKNCLPPTSTIITNPADLQCARHNIVTEYKPVIDECITTIPVIKNRIKEKEEVFTHNIPILTNHISTREEKRLCHIPIVNQQTRNVIEHEHDHIPITQSNLVHIVQPYVDQVPVIRPYVRPIVEESLSHVPVVESCVKPVIHHSVSSVPITERRITPTIHQEVTNVPIGVGAPPYGYCETPQIQHHYASDSLPLTASAEHLNYPDLQNHYINEGSVDHYGAASSPVPSYSYANQGADYVNGGELSREPQYDETLSNFRRNLYLPTGTSSPQEDCYSPYQEASLPSAPEEYLEDKNVGEGRYVESNGPAAVEPLGEQQELPQESSETAPDYYTRHNDYCD